MISLLDISFASNLHITPTALFSLNFISFFRLLFDLDMLVLGRCDNFSVCFFRMKLQHELLEYCWPDASKAEKEGKNSERAIKASEIALGQDLMNS